MLYSIKIQVKNNIFHGDIGFEAGEYKLELKKEIKYFFIEVTSMGNITQNILLIIIIVMIQIKKIFNKFFFIWLCLCVSIEINK